MYTYFAKIECDAAVALGHACSAHPGRTQSIGFGEECQRANEAFSPNINKAQESAFRKAIQGGWVSVDLEGWWLCPICADEWRAQQATKTQPKEPEDKPGIAKMARQIGVLADLIWQEAGE